MLHSLPASADHMISWSMSARLANVNSTASLMEPICRGRPINIRIKQ